MSERHARLFRNYTHLRSLGEEAVPIDSHLPDDEETFLLLQSFCMACVDPHATTEEADAAATLLLPRCDALANTLIVDIVHKMYTQQWRHAPII